MSPKPKQKRGYHHGNLRDALVQAAIEQVGADGLETLTIRRVAGRVGVTPGAAYHHFESKQHLLVAAAEVAFGALLERMQAAAAAETEPLDRLIALGRAYIEHCVGAPAHFRIMVGRHVRELEDLSALAPSGRQTLELLADVTAQCAASVGGAVDSTQLMRAAWAQVVGVVSLVVEREIAPNPTAEDVRALIDTSMSILRGGILALAAARD